MDWLYARLRASELPPPARRARRVVLLLGFLCIANAFDLVFTFMASAHGHFQEANPIARGLIGTPVALVAFKCLFVALASAIIFRFRTRRFTEGSCWCISVVYSMLAGVWWQYFFAPW